MAPIKVYGVPLSPPFRTVITTCEALGLDYEIVPANPLIGETNSPEFLKLNPQHNIPVVVDGDFVVNESRACAAYLVNAHAKEGCKLYPVDPQVRAIIDQRLYFDMGTFFKAVLDCFGQILFGPAKEATPAALERLHEVLGWVRDFVKPTGYIAGTDHLTIADLAFVASYSSLLEGKQVNLSQYDPELGDWYVRCKAEIPNYQRANGEGAEHWGQFLQSRLKENNNKV